MTSTAISAQGTKVSMNTSTDMAPVWTLIKNVYEFSGFDGAASDIDVTDLQSDAKEYRAGLQDWDSVTMGININMKDESHQALLAAKKSGAVKEFKTELSDGTTMEFSGYVKNFPIQIAVDSVYKGSVQVKISATSPSRRPLKESACFFQKNSCWPRDSRP